MAREKDTLFYTLDLGPFDHDVEVRKVTISVEGVNESTVVNVDVTDNSVPNFNLVEVSGPQDAKATLTIVDVDDSGNLSTPVVHELVLADVVSPQPGAVVKVVGVKEVAGAPIVTPPAPEEPAPAPEEPAPAPEEPAPAPEEPVVEEPAPAPEEPVVEEPAPAPEEPAPAPEEPVVEEPAPESDEETQS